MKKINQTPDDRFGKHYNKFWNKQMKDPEFKKEYDKLSVDDRFDEKLREELKRTLRLYHFDQHHVIEETRQSVDGEDTANHLMVILQPFLHSEIDLARAEMVEPGAVIRAIDEVRNETLEQAAKAVEGMKKEEKVCAYCLDTHWMKVNQGRGRIKNLPCVW